MPQAESVPVEVVRGVVPAWRRPRPLQDLLTRARRQLPALPRSQPHTQHGQQLGQRRRRAANAPRDDGEAEGAATPSAATTAAPLASPSAAAAALDATPEHHGDEHPLQPGGGLLRLRAPDPAGPPQRDRRHPSSVDGGQQQ